MPEVNGKTKDWRLWMAGLLVSVTAAFIGVQWQTQHDATEVANKKINQLISLHEQDMDTIEADHDADIARLDESNRNRRNQIADLEERIARLEERTS